MEANRKKKGHPYIAASSFFPLTLGKEKKRKKKRALSMKKKKKEEEDEEKNSLPSLRERSETPGALDRRALGEEKENKSLAASNLYERSG